MDERWSWTKLTHQFFTQITEIDRGFLYTVKGMFLFPGKVITDYWECRTVNYFNPFRFVIIWVAINIIFSFWLGIDDYMQQNLEPALFDANGACIFKDFGPFESQVRLSLEYLNSKTLYFLQVITIEDQLIETILRQ